MGTNFYSRVYEACMKIPKGKVATYGQIAFMAGNPKAARQVGFALHRNPNFGIIPCHRVVNRFGRLAPSFAFGGPEIQRDLLISEGVEVSDDGFVNLDEYKMNI